MAILRCFVCFSLAIVCVFADSAACDTEDCTDAAVDGNVMMQKRARQGKGRDKAESSYSKKAKHVIFFVIDDLGWADVGYHGSNFPTPNIDRLAGEEGVILDRMYVTPQCSPSRSALISGRYTHKIGMQHYTTTMPGVKASVGEGTNGKTMASMFSDAGYQTHAIGKWHLGYGTKKGHPYNIGFDSFLGTLTAGIEYLGERAGMTGTCGKKMCLYPSNKGKSDSPWGNQDGPAAMDFWFGEKAKGELEIVLPPIGYTEDRYINRAVELIEAYGSGKPPTKPLFIYFVPQLNHEPFQVPEKMSNLCPGVTGGSHEVNRTVLCQMTVQLDEHFASLEKALKGAGIWDDTLIMAVSDNGGMIYWSDAWPSSVSSNYPLRGSKTTLYEGGVRVPAFLTGGAVPKSARGQVRNADTHLMNAVDLLPTLANLAGVSRRYLPPSLDGKDLSATVLKGDDNGRTSMVLYVGVNPMGGFTSTIPDDMVDTLNFTSVLGKVDGHWYKIIVGVPFTPLGADPNPLSRGGYVTIDPYNYVADPDGEMQSNGYGPDGTEIEVPDHDDFPRSRGRLTMFRLFDITADPNEENDLAPKAKSDAESKEAQILWELLEEAETAADPANGWVKEQENMPMMKSNPACYNYTYKPAPYKVRCGLKSIKDMLAQKALQDNQAA